jgi:hypothetical protein
MHVRVMFQVLTPCVQHAQEADLGAKVLRIACQLKHGSGAGGVEQIIDDPLVAKGKCREFVGKSEYDVEVVNGQQLR